MTMDKHKNMAGQNQLLDPNPLSLIIGSPTTIHIQTNNKKAAQIHFLSIRLPTITKINDDTVIFRLRFWGRISDPVPM